MKESLPMNKFSSIYWHFHSRYFHEFTNSSYACVMESNLKNKPTQYQGHKLQYLGKLRVQLSFSLQWG